MLRETFVALRMAAITILLTGVAYPLLITGAARLFFPARAAGSLVERDGVVVGSSLIGQAFRGAAYFQPRPSAAGRGGYDGMASGGSNLGPTSARLRARIVAERDRLRGENPDAPGPVPVDLVTASASGLDPHIGPAAALWQAPRVAVARGRSTAEIEAVVARHVEPRSLGVFGEPRVNVLLLNLDLDARFGRPR
jgi:K+-transporting ATPase ATPase C chain